MLAERRLLVGVTDNCLLKGKILAPLIQTRERRAIAVKNFLQMIGFDVNKLEVFFLTDTFGPPAYQPDFDCIVASVETVEVSLFIKGQFHSYASILLHIFTPFKACEKINQMRSDKGFPLLHIEKVEFVEGKG